MLKKCRRSEVELWYSSSFPGTAVLHLLPRLPAGAGAGQIQGALAAPQQPAHADPRWPADAGFWPRGQPRPPGPHHHVQRQRKRQDPQETGGVLVHDKSCSDHLFFVFVLESFFFFPNNSGAENYGQAGKNLRYKTTHCGFWSQMGFVDRNKNVEYQQLCLNSAHVSASVVTIIKTIVSDSTVVFVKGLRTEHFSQN